LSRKTKGFDNEVKKMSKKSKYGTDFMESEAILAITAEDDQEAKRQLQLMTETEIKGFILYLERLARLGDEVLDEESYTVL
jgi:hypothetical protein